MNKIDEYYILGNHPIFKYVNLKVDSYEVAEGLLEDLHELGYETELYKLDENGEKTYIK